MKKRGIKEDEYRYHSKSLPLFKNKKNEHFRFEKAEQKFKKKNAELA